MATDTELISDEFSDVACKLLKEYSAEIEKLRIDSIKVLDSYYKSDPLKSDKENAYLARRLQNNCEFFLSFIPAYETLVRKTSQWIQHAKDSRPGKQLELEVRLEEFEQRLEAVHRFFDTNQI